ncbi:MAG: DUF192 domain-containing protein [bacterium]|nr:DUF192 domain-containing protein [bacterium]
MVLVNRTRSVVISENIREAKTYAEKKQGLIGSDGKTGLLFKTRWGVHTFGMAFSIDVLVLNKKNKVVKYKRNLKPNRVMFWMPACDKVVEIPTALMLEGIVEVGNELEIKN